MDHKYKRGRRSQLSLEIGRIWVGSLSSDSPAIEAKKAWLGKASVMAVEMETVETVSRVLPLQFTGLKP